MSGQAEEDVTVERAWLGGARLLLMIACLALSCWQLAMFFGFEAAPWTERAFTVVLAATCAGTLAVVADDIIKRRFEPRPFPIFEEFGWIAVLSAAVIAPRLSAPSWLWSWLAIVAVGLVVVRKVRLARVLRSRRGGAGTDAWAKHWFFLLLQIAGIALGLLSLPVGQQSSLGDPLVVFALQMFIWWLKGAERTELHTEQARS